ncbi:hypothetical protein CEXT_234541 [Caerostris extrusa]|uniref:Uncharacterized protein n=1 Tax=Caerostris extrusa TaxID=172846 RepID=A0AAV4Y503_CAEEX|nr:hypothetical protein CEXT_234541 [Caerostris extrusa]
MWNHNRDKTHAEDCATIIDCVEKALRRHAIQVNENQLQCLVGALSSAAFVKNRNRRVHRSVCGSARTCRRPALLLPEDWDEERLRCPFCPLGPD